MSGPFLSTARRPRRRARRALIVLALVAVPAIVLAVAFAVYLLVAPGSHGGDWRLLAVLAIGQAWILMRILTRLAFLSTSAALVQQSLAHAEYTAAPPPIWPDSPAAEAIENAARFGTRPTT